MGSAATASHRARASLESPAPSLSKSSEKSTTSAFVVAVAWLLAAESFLLGLVGIVAGVGNGLWLLTGRRAVGMRRNAVGAAVEERYRSRPRRTAVAPMAGGQYQAGQEEDERTPGDRS